MVFFHSIWQLQLLFKRGIKIKFARHTAYSGESLKTKIYDNTVHAYRIHTVQHTTLTLFISLLQEWQKINK